MNEETWNLFLYPRRVSILPYRYSNQILKSTDTIEEEYSNVPVPGVALERPRLKQRCRSVVP